MEKCLITCLGLHWFSMGTRGFLKVVDASIRGPSCSKNSTGQILMALRDYLVLTSSLFSCLGMTVAVPAVRKGAWGSKKTQRDKENGDHAGRLINVLSTCFSIFRAFPGFIEERE